MGLVLLYFVWDPAAVWWRPQTIEDYVWVVVGWILNAAYTAFWATVVIVTYHQLRLVKEGPEGDKVAAVFD